MPSYSDSGHSSNMGHEMRLNDNELSHFGIAKSFSNNDNKINSLDFFSADGKHLVTAGDDDAITIYDSENGKRKQTLYSKKYGVQRIKYTHNNSCVLYRILKKLSKSDKNSSKATK